MENTAVLEGASVKEKSAPLTIFGIKSCYFFVAMMVFAFLGFWVENIARMITKNVFDSRHQLLPFLFAYGLALLAIYIVLGTPDEMRFFNIRIFRKKDIKSRVFSHLSYFLVICAFIMLGEIGVGMIYEKVAGVILWDYTSIPTHITRYTSLITTALFGGGVYAIMAFAFRPMIKLISKMGTTAATVLDCTLGVAIIIDFLIMILYTFITGSAPEYWSVAW